MAKPSELSNDQLSKKINDYDRILNALLKERDRRFTDNIPVEMLTTNEKQALKESKAKDSPQDKSINDDMMKVGSGQVNLDFGEKTMSIINKNSPSDDNKDGSSNLDESVNITKVLNLSKEELEEFNKVSKKSRETKEKK